MVRMAKIVLSDEAPKGAGVFSLANATIEAPYETRDAEILANAVVHPWLSVEPDDTDVIVGAYRDRQVKPEDDALSAQNSVANDPEAVKAELARREAEYALVAIQAGLDQDTPTYVGPVATTVAAANETDEPPKARRSVAKEE